ncbi:hypothetical protein ACET3Z_005254 [Daucus carota]
MLNIVAVYKDSETRDLSNLKQLRSFSHLRFSIRQLSTTFSRVTKLSGLYDIIQGDPDKVTVVEALSVACVDFSAVGAVTAGSAVSTLLLLRFWQMYLYLRSDKLAMNFDLKSLDLALKFWLKKITNSLCHARPNLNTCERTCFSPFKYSDWSSYSSQDFKSTNILLNDNYEAKISDFRLVKFMPDGHENCVTATVLGNFGYFDPEYKLDVENSYDYFKGRHT